MPHYRSKVDVIQPKVTEALRGIGCKVKPLHMLGKGFGDLLVARSFVVCVMEVKSGEKATKPRGKSQAATNAAQADFQREWGQDMHILRVFSPEDAVSKMLKLCQNPH